MRGKCALYKEEKGYKPFLITKELNKSGRRIIIHKQTGLTAGQYEKFLASHKKLWEEVMDEIDEMEKCFVCEKPCWEWCESRDWCNTCKDQNIWRCEYCDEIQYNKTYRTDRNGEAWCKKCCRKYEATKAKVIADMKRGIF
jgi:hypothetical protein